VDNTTIGARLFVSILIPVFNREKYISECIESALAQTYSHFEIVIVDNVSSDKTAEICKEYAGKHSKIRFFSNQTNVGPVRNWQRCVSEAKGDLIKLLFSDDLLLPDCLEKMIPKLTGDVAFVYSACLVGATIESSAERYGSADDGLQSEDQYINALLNGDAPVSPGAILIRTEDIKKNLHTTFPTAAPQRFDKHGAGPDVMILLLTAKQYPFIFAIARPLIFFRIHADSFTLQNVGNEVRQGHRSAISLYLKNRYGINILIRYLAIQWIAEMVRSRKFYSPRLFLHNHEALSSLVEQYRLMRESFSHIYKKLLKKKFVFIK
jgi:glycosyltransferase involved in cell wall biosynthesis